MKAEQQYALIIIESLKENDKKTGTILELELLKLKKFQNPGILTKVFSIQSKDQLISLLESIISTQGNNGFIPHLHFEIHGFENGLELNNGDRINWSELMEYFSKINFLTKNYLVIYLAVCYGLSILRNINPLGRAPFKALIAPGREVSEMQILSGFTSFYDEYFSSFDLKESLKRMNEEIGESIFGLIPIDFCYEKITRLEPDSEFGKELLCILKNRLINEFPWIQNESEDEINDHVLKSFEKLKEYLRSKEDYFFMKDVK